MTVKELWESGKIENGDVFKRKIFNEISNVTIINNESDNRQYLLNLDYWSIECNESEFDKIEVVEIKINNIGGNNGN